MCRMLAVLFILAIVAVSLSTEQVSCINGKRKCKKLNPIIANKKHYCCKKGLILKYTQSENKKKGTCVCEKKSSVPDCLVGIDQCQNASNLISDGSTIKCCPNGYSISSISNSYINGAYLNYCKCSRGGSIGILGGRLMTKEEEAIFKQTMANFSQNLKANMKEMQQTLHENLQNINSNIGTVLGGGFLNGLTRSLNRMSSDLGSTLQNAINQVARANNIAQTVQPRLPWQGSIWDLQQRRLQQQQRRLNGYGLSYWDRLSRNPAISQMMSPSFWFSNIWNGLYGHRNQTA